MKFKIILFMISLCLSINIFAQLSFSEQNTTCYCKSAGYSVRNILQSDSNYLIAKSLWEYPKSAAELSKSGIQYTQSQLLLLQAFKIISKDGDKYSSNIPFLDSVNTDRVRKDAKVRAESIYTFIESDIKQLVNYLNKKGLRKMCFRFCFLMCWMEKFGMNWKKETLFLNGN